MKGPKPYPTIVELARVANWPRLKMDRLIRRVGGLVRMNGTLCADPDVIRRELPELWERYLAASNGDSSRANLVVYLPMQWVANAIGSTLKFATSWLEHNGGVVVRAGRRRTTPELLLRIWPEKAHLFLGDEDF